MNNVSKISQFKSDTLMSLKGAQSPQALKEETLKILNNIGFSDFDITQINVDKSIDSLATTLSPTLHATYCQENMHEYDASLECLSQSSIPIYFADIFKHIASSPYSSDRIQKNGLIYELMNSYGHMDGYCVPAQTKSSMNKFTILLMAEGESSENIKSLVKAERARLHELINILCWCVAQPKMLRGLCPGSRPALSVRQLEVLNALANFAKTNQEVAEQLGITVRTVAKHVEDIKLSLGARSIPNAVSLAIGYGLILPAVR